MGKFLNFFVPSKSNNHHPYLIRNHFLLSFVIIAVCLANLPKVYFPSEVIPQTEVILGVASNINKEEVIKLTNQERAAQGLSALSASSSLDQAAILKAQDMVSKDYWAHNTPEGKEPWYFFGQAGYSFVFAGENLAKNFDNSSQVVSAWMASSSHKENILNKNYSEIGIAIMNGKLQGEDTTLVVQMFGTPVGKPPYQTPAEEKAVQVAQVPVPSPVQLSPTPEPSPIPSVSPKASMQPVVVGAKTPPTQVMGMRLDFSPIEKISSLSLQQKFLFLLLILC